MVRGVFPEFLSNSMVAYLFVLYLNRPIYIYLVIRYVYECCKLHCNVYCSVLVMCNSSDVCVRVSVFITTVTGFTKVKSIMLVNTDII